MQKTTVAVVLAIVALLLLAGVATHRLGGGMVARWLAAHRAGASH